MSIYVQRIEQISKNALRVVERYCIVRNVIILAILFVFIMIPTARSTHFQCIDQPLHLKTFNIF